MIVEATAGALRAARIVASIDYGLYRVFTTKGRPAAASALPDGIDAFTVDDDTACGRTYALKSGGAALCSAQIWWGDTYRKRRDYFRLAEGEAELVYLETAAAARGRGLATDLLSRIAGDFSRMGLTRLRARVWHSNKASAQAFRKAGWQETWMRIDLRRRSWTRTMEIRWE